MTGLRPILQKQQKPTANMNETTAKPNAIFRGIKHAFPLRDVTIINQFPEHFNVYANIVGQEGRGAIILGLEEGARLHAEWEAFRGANDLPPMVDLEMETMLGIVMAERDEFAAELAHGHNCPVYQEGSPSNGMCSCTPAGKEEATQIRREAYDALTRLHLSAPVDVAATTNNSVRAYLDFLQSQVVAQVRLRVAAEEALAAIKSTTP